VIPLVPEPDVAVVGAGLGGLGAAVHLAGAGLKVGVFERQERPGGVATSYSVGPYTFEASLHLLDAVGPGAPNRPLLDSLGLTGRLDLRQDPDLRREVWPERGWDLTYPQGPEGFVETFAGVFPHERAGAAALLDHACAIHAGAYATLRGEPLSPPMQRHMLDLMPRTGAEVISRFVRDPHAIAALGTVSPYRGLDVWEIGAIPYLVLLAAYHRWGGSYPVGGSRALTEGLVAALAERGGVLHRGRGVRALIARRGAVHGVILEDGTEVRARRVVSAVSPLVTLLEWLSEEDLPPRWRDRLARMPLSASLVRLSLGLDTDPRSLAPLGHETWVVREQGAEPLSSVTVTAPRALDPGCAPEGAGVLAITSRFPGNGSALSAEEKEAISERLTAVAERHLLPGLSRHVVVRDLAHPATYQRYTGAPGGAVFGFAAPPAHSGPRRLGAATPVRNLALAGGWVFPGAGQTSALWSGQLAARHILEGLT